MQHKPKMRGLLVGQLIEHDGEVYRVAYVSGTQSQVRAESADLGCRRQRGRPYLFLTRREAILAAVAHRRVCA